MLDDLRNTGDDKFEDDFNFGDDADDDAGFDEPLESNEGGKFFGLRPVERMVLSIMLFLVVLVFGILVLIATGRIVL